MTLWAKIKAAILPARDESRGVRDYGPQLLVSEPLFNISPAVLQALSQSPGTTELHLELPERVVPLVLLRDYGTGRKYISSDGRFVALLIVEESRDFTVRDAYSSLLIADFFRRIDTFKCCLPSRHVDAGDCGQCAGTGIDPSSEALSEMLADRFILVCQECAGLGWKTMPGALDRRLARCNAAVLPDRWGPA